MQYGTVAIFLVVSLTTCSFGQSAGSDSTFLRSSKDQAIGFYEQALYRQIHVYDGHEYISHDHRVKVHPYYKTDSLQAGAIVYNGIHYHDIQILYDIVRDELAIQPPDGPFRIRPRNDQIAAFSVGTHRFTRIVGDSATGIPSGFYEILYAGKIKALAKRRKTVFEDISSGAYHGEYLQKDRFYILNEGVYHEVKTKRSALTLFPDQAKPLRKYLRRNQLKFNDEQRQEAIIRLTQRYEELTQ